MRNLVMVMSLAFLAASATAHAQKSTRQARSRVSTKAKSKAAKRQQQAHARPKVKRGLGKLFQKLARKKGDRVFHAQGQAYHATVKQADGSVKPAIVRVSRGGAGKAGKRDILGVAVKVKEKSGRDQDFLMVTALGTRGLGARIPALRGSFAGKKISSLTSFRVGKLRGPITAKLPKSLRTQLDLNAPGVSNGPQTFKLELQNASIISRLFQRAAPKLSLGEVTVDFSRQLSAKQNAALKMTPFNDAGGVKPAGIINRLRRAAYIGSQTGRGAR